MQVTSITFLMFVVISLFIYWYCPYKIQWCVLLIDSIVFYLLNAYWSTFIYIAISVLSTWIAGMLINNSENDTYRRVVLVSTIVVNVGILSVLKYSGMFVRTIGAICETQLNVIDFLQPLAISYYTLQLIGYLVDCYQGKLEVEKNIFKLLLFAIFFPQMVAGPISRWGNLGNQLFKENRFEYDRVIVGMRRVLWGILKKILVADRLAIVVEEMFSETDVFVGIWVIIAAFVFVVQLYFDFSGCMDIVCGVSACFGIKLPENFDSPFCSSSIKEFWRRWHITLGTWLRDYIMFPIARSRWLKRWEKNLRRLCGRRGAQIPNYFAMFCVWTLMGIWHGSSWKYVIGEGWFFFMVIIVGEVFSPLFRTIKQLLRIDEKKVCWKVFQVIRTMLLFSIGNIAFRAESINTMLKMYRNTFKVGNVLVPLRVVYNTCWPSFGGVKALILLMIVVVIQAVIDIVGYNTRNQEEIAVRFARMPIIIRWGIYVVGALILIFNGTAASPMFIYMGF